MREIKAIHAIEQITSTQLTGREMVCFLVPDSRRPKFLVKIDTNLWGFVAPDNPTSGPTFVESSYEKAIQKALEGKRQLFTFDDMEEAMKYLPDMIREARKGGSPSGKEEYVALLAENVRRAKEKAGLFAVNYTDTEASILRTEPPVYDLAGSGEPLPSQANMKKMAAAIHRLTLEVARLTEKENAPVVYEKKVEPLPDQANMKHIAGWIAGANEAIHLLTERVKALEARQQVPADTPAPAKPTDNTEYIPYDLFIRILDRAHGSAYGRNLVPNPKEAMQIEEISKRNNFFGPADRYIHVVLTP